MGFRLPESLEDERELECSRSLFVSNVSHELKTPVTKIQLFNELLQRLPAGAHEKRAWYHQALKHECDRLLHLIDNVLDFGAAARGDRTYARERIDVEALLGEVAAQVRTQCAARGYEVDVDAAGHLPVLRGDAAALRRALTNLVDNALKYSEPHTLRLEARTAWLHGVPAVALTVRDRGIGIAPEQCSLIFGEFYRVETGLAQRASGSGLGLTLVRDVAEAHGGTIAVESAEGEGSAFTLLLPVDVAEPTPHPPPTSPNEDASS